VHHNPIAKFNLEVASWTTTFKVTTAGSFLVVKDNVGEDGLSSQLTYKKLIVRIIKLPLLQLINY
jgi:hypothetical protein